VRLAVQLQDSGAFAIAKPIITASGSAWYDLIAEVRSAERRGRFLSVLRPGSYVAHDHGIYKEAQCCVLDRRSDLHEGCARRWKSGRTCSRCRSRASR
jgi:D-serine deaminase-like pyridoxal phosphate-dependent protein